ncbi:unnamed protein product, partial [Candidula unifasciata]
LKYFSLISICESLHADLISAPKSASNGFGLSCQIMTETVLGKTPMLKLRMDRKRTGIQKVLDWNQFSSLEMETLYQRYVFKIQQSAMMCMALLFTVLCLSLAVLTTAFVRNYTVYSLFLYGEGLIFFIFFIVMKSNLMKEQHFMAVNYVFLAFVTILGVVSVPLPFGSPPGFEDHKLNMADGAWVVAFVIFNIYALTPLQTLPKCILGGSIPLVHLVVSSQTCNQLPDLLWRQVSIVV